MSTFILSCAGMMERGGCVVVARLHTLASNVAVRRIWLTPGYFKKLDIKICSTGSIFIFL